MPELVFEFVAATFWFEYAAPVRAVESAVDAPYGAVLAVLECNVEPLELVVVVVLASWLVVSLLWPVNLFKRLDILV